jgi:hypothetical protein
MKQEKALFWVLATGSDCDGYNSGSIFPFANYEEAITSAEGSNEWSDGIKYYVTDNWGVVLEYCNDYMKDPNNYIYV